MATLSVAIAGLAVLGGLVWLRPSADSRADRPSDERSGGMAAGEAEPEAPSNPAGGEASGGVAEPKARKPMTPFGVGAEPAVASPRNEREVDRPPEGSAAAGGSASPNKAVANRDDIRESIRELLPQIKDCFEQALKLNPDLEGTAKVEFVLSKAPDGGAYAREGEVNNSTVNAPLLEACLLDRVQHAHFKELKGEGEVRVSYPFKFGSSSGFGGKDPDQSPR
jgi:hypothetical protein